LVSPKTSASTRAAFPWLREVLEEARTIAAKSASAAKRVGLRIAHIISSDRQEPESEATGKENLTHVPSVWLVTHSASGNSAFTRPSASTFWNM